jgi:NTE family protein
MNFLRLLPLLALTTLLTACPSAPIKEPPTLTPPPPIELPPLKIGLALGGGAAKGFAHIGVIKMLEANGIKADVIAGTSAGSVVGAMYASGMDIFLIQQKAVTLDESTIRDVKLFSGGLIEGKALQDYINTEVGNQPIEKLKKPFAAVATRLDTGERIVFVLGNVGQAVRASSSVPGVFQPTKILGYSYVDGGVVSPVPVDAARQLGADVVIAVDISTNANGATPNSLVNIVGQSITIMGQTLGKQEMARADVVIRPQINDIGSTDFDQRHNALLEGERAALQAMPKIKAAIEAAKKRQLEAAQAQRP